MAGKLRVEGWTLPSTGTFKRKFFHVPVVGGTGRRELSAWHSVSLDIPRSWSRLPDLLSGTLLRVYDGSKVVDEFVAERMPQELRTDSTVTVTGPQVAGLTQRIGIYPPDYPENPPRRPNWIWNGKNIAAPLDLADLRHINSEWIIYLERERYGLSINNATKGQIRFTYDGDTSDPVSYNPSANAVKEAIEGLDGINEVYVLKHEDESFTIVILNPTKLDGDLAVGAVPDSDFDGSLDFDKHAEGFDSSSNPTFTISVTTADGSETTGNLPWNASTFAIEQALEGLGNIRDVTVQGSGHFGDPWEIVFYVPPQVDNMQVSFAAGSVVIRETVK